MVGKILEPERKSETFRRQARGPTKKFNKEILTISQQLDYTKSDIEDLRLKVMELEKELQNREREIMRLRRCGSFLFGLLIVSIVIAAIALRRASKAAKAVSPPKT